MSLDTTANARQLWSRGNPVSQNIFNLKKHSKNQVNKCQQPSK